MARVNEELIEASGPDRGIEWEADAVAYLKMRGYYILDQYHRLKGNPEAMNSLNQYIERQVRHRIEDVLRRA